MKLYVTTYIDDAPDTGDDNGVKWYGTQADQKKDARQLKADGMRNILPATCDVPTNKEGLRHFLNYRGVRP